MPRTVLLPGKTRIGRARRSQTQPGCWKSAAFLAASLAFSAPAYATKQCPPEFGTKNPLVNMIGWLVVAAGVAVGGWLFAYLVRRTRGMRWLPRYAVIATGFVGMIALWIAGFALAFVYFFIQC